MSAASIARKQDFVNERLEQLTAGITGLETFSKQAVEDWRSAVDTYESVEQPVEVMLRARAHE